jgi:hypothetical protein
LIFERQLAEYALRKEQQTTLCLYILQAARWHLLLSSSTPIQNKPTYNPSLPHQE